MCSNMSVSTAREAQTFTLFLGPGVSLCMSLSTACVRGRLYLYLLFCMWPQQTPAAPSVLLAMTMIFLFVFMGLVYQMPSTIMRTYQELPRRRRRPEQRVVFRLSFSWNKSWMTTRGLTGLLIRIHSQKRGLHFLQLRMFALSGLNKLQDLRVQTLFTVLTGRVAQQMLSGQKTDGPNTRGTCCSY